MTDIEIQIGNSLEELKKIKELVASAARDWELPQKTAAEIRLILEELCVNHIEHSGDSSSGDIAITLSCDESEITITVKDNGPPFDPTMVSPPDLTLPLAKRQPGGLGLHFVKHFSDNFLYLRENDANIMTIIKKRGEASRGEHGHHNA